MPSAAETDDETITIVLADDHELVRAGIRKILEDEAGFEVVAEAGDAEAAARYVLGHKPSVLILDLSMPGLPSLEALPKVFEASPDTKVVVLTMQNEPAFARTSLQGGAKGYVIKHSAASELVTAIHAVVAGGTYINPELGARLAAEPDKPEGPPDELTPREVEVLGLLALGYVNPEIAEKLVLSVRTVETHRANIQRKTGLSTRAELIAYAIDNELVER
ncbi:MAG TPA: response regulator transcription factor [Solirubrobacterales bacterium]|nr:response regulator transcription factor [Solirubrobacterales bacterium]